VENQEKVKLVNADCCRQAKDAHALACASGGKVASSAWIIDSVAGCNLQPL
jgi:BRCA1-associated RING domain protein 1